MAAAEVWALMPLKSAAAAKSRLAPALGEAARRRLFFAMAGQGIAALAAALGADRVFVVAADPAVLEFATGLGARPLAIAEDRGISSACDEAVAILSAEGVRALLIVPGDLPLLTAEAVAALVAETVACRVAIVPDRRRAGTNGLLLRPPDILPVAFGPGSFERHRRMAEAAGLDVGVFEDPSFALDIDEPEDLALLPEALRRTLKG